jgi:hypothetical protein
VNIQNSGLQIHEFMQLYIKITSISDNQNPLSYALSELLKGQLDLTANFLSTQKRLYANYCASLSTIMQEEPKPAEFDKVIN